MNVLRKVINRAGTTLEMVRSRHDRADISFFFTFVPPPYGGGNQFLRALWSECERRGYHLENNRISPVTRACLCNAFNFDFDRLRRFAREGCRILHRVDGPVGVYRGRDDEIDRRIWSLNQEVADVTVFQSRYSLEEHERLGLRFTAPRVIHNAADPSIFHAQGRTPFSRARRTRLIATSWSDNPNKGAAVYKWLEERLDWNRFDLTFVGRTSVPFDRIRVIPPQSSEGVASLLRSHDIFLTASLHDPCSNALIEALSCGLPALYAESGGHPELVRDAGFGFSERDQILPRLEKLVEEYDMRQARIAAPSLPDVADAYLDAMELPPSAGA